MRLSQKKTNVNGNSWCNNVLLARLLRKKSSKQKTDLRWEENCFQVAYKIHQTTYGIFLVSIISEVMNM